MPNGSLDGSFGTDGIADFSTIIELNPLSTMALADVAIGGDGNPVPQATFFDQNRTQVNFDQVNPVVYDAILSSEDKGFYEHGGINLGFPQND